MSKLFKSKKIKSGKRRIFLLFLLSTHWSLSQTVPREMDFGGIHLTIKDHARRQIQQDVDRLTRSQDYVNILADRINLYLPIIENTFASEGVPDEIKFLAIQESALISDAVSSANAVGFWQFKDFTAREVGLKVDRRIDERLNIVAATKGASNYLKKNNFFYDNWIYAVIAYNTGRGGAQKHIDKSKFGAKRMTIDNQTHWYVKKFLAHVVAFAPYVGKPHSENMWLATDTNAKNQSLGQIARKHKVSVEELEKYNKWLKHGSVPGDKSYAVLIPTKGSPPKRFVASNSSKTKRRISEHQRNIYPTEIKYGISDGDKATIIPLNGIPSILARSDDNIRSISARAGISEKKFRKYNEVSTEDQIIPSEFYYVRKKKSKSNIGFHVAKNGETLWSVSQKYGIRISKLAKMNRMNIIDPLEVGRVLWMKKARPADVAIEFHEQKETEVISEESDKIIVPRVDSSAELKKIKIHVVAKDESLWSIAKKYDVLMEDLLRWNKLENPHALRIGQNIQVKAPIEEASIGKLIVKHTVRAGETLYAISIKYNMTVDELMELNKKTSTTLGIGELLKVYGR